MLKFSKIFFLKSRLGPKLRVSQVTPIQWGGGGGGGLWKNLRASRCVTSSPLGQQLMPGGGSLSIILSSRFIREARCILMSFLSNHLSHFQSRSAFLYSLLFVVYIKSQTVDSGKGWIG